MKKKFSPIFLLIIISFISCKKEQIIKESIKELSIKEAIDKLKSPLTSKPLRWTNEQLAFLDPLGEKSILGLGEATHGSKEFFQAKHRIFKYLAENHGYKVFAMEADLGESIFINEAIQDGNTSAIRGIMKEKMLFNWVWKTEEVAAFLEWMSEYNKGKSDEEKLQYVGIDNTVNEYYSDFLLTYLTNTAPDLLAQGQPILANASKLLGKGAKSSNEELIQLEFDLNQLFLNFSDKKERIIQASSNKVFELNNQYFRVLFQAIENRQELDYSKSPRDRFMAENALWYQNFLGNEKMVINAHNLHVGNITNDIKSPVIISNFMGSFLKIQLGDAYQIIGFSFSGGQYNARQIWSNNEVTEPLANSWFLPIEESTINSKFNMVEDQAFFISTKKLNENEMWSNFAATNPTKITVGAVFFIESRHLHLFPYKDFHYDFLIHFQNTKPTSIFRN